MRESSEFVLAPDHLGPGRDHRPGIVERLCPDRKRPGRWASAFARLLDAWDEVRELSALINLGLASLHRGRYEQARATFREAVRLSLALRWPECLAVGLEGLASLDAEQGDPLRATRLMGAADGLLETAGYVLEAGERELHEQTLAAVGARLDRQDFESAWLESGSGLSLLTTLRRRHVAQQLA